MAFIGLVSGVIFIAPDGVDWCENVAGDDDKLC